MNDLCQHCEYGNRFKDLGQCPECATGRIVGDLHTRGIFCSNLHRITAVAIDFCGWQNCTETMTFQYYDVIITSELSYEQLVNIGKDTERTPVQIYKAVKNGQSFLEKMSFHELLKFCEYLYVNNISFRIEPDLPYFSNFPECFPELAEGYQLIRGNMHE